MQTTVPTVALYTKVLAGLLLLTLLTFVQPSWFHLSPGGTAGVQLLIAAMKVALVAAYYMHLRSETEYLKGYVGMALVILLIFFVLVGIDVVHS
jgi:caa(3)-type oxidase subunit IV